MSPASCPVMSDRSTHSYS